MLARRAIFKFIVDDARSFGKFINNVLKQSRVVVENHGDMTRYVLAECA